MLNIGIATPTDPQYEEISDFAKRVYGKKLHAMIAGRPDIFSFAEMDKKIIGCFGLYEGKERHPLLFETYFSDDVFRKFFQVTRKERSLIGELGTRAVLIPDGELISVTDVSIVLAATLILTARKRGVCYLGFTANRSVLKIADALEIKMTSIGKPDLSKKDEIFRENWKEFFRVKQQCFMIDLTHSIRGCTKTLKELTSNGFIAKSEELCALYTS